jgi:nicotinamidase-related amidase
MAMRDRNPDLHGNAPDKSPVALLLIDVINDLEWSGGERIYEHALKMAKNIRALKDRAREAKVPVVYVNDNFGRWKSNFNSVVEHCLESKGKEIAELLKPEPEDYFVLKPKHSGFYSTSLDILLDYLEAKSVIITGMQTNICVLFTANEAYMRDFKLYVPPDCCAAELLDDHKYAMNQIKKILKANVTVSSELNFSDM